MMRLRGLLPSSSWPVSKAVMGIARLRHEGWRVNHKRVDRLWRHEGLTVPTKQLPRRWLWLTDGACFRLRAEHLSIDGLRPVREQACRICISMTCSTQQSSARRGGCRVCNHGKTARPSAGRHGRPVHAQLETEAPRSGGDSGRTGRVAFPRGGEGRTRGRRGQLWAVGGQLQKRTAA